jgi:CRP/FNR family transcriptional regulator, cyclic AMP receptor protein
MFTIVQTRILNHFMFVLARLAQGIISLRKSRGTVPFPIEDLMTEHRSQSSSTDILLADAGKSSQYAERSVVYTQGAKGHSIFYVQQGVVMLAAKSKGKRPAVLAVLPAGHFFNESCLLNHSTYPSTASTLVPSSILAIGKDDMLRLIHAEAIISNLFRTHLLTTNVRFREDLLDVLVNSVKQRLARALLRLANINSDEPHKAHIPRISQRALAEMVGTTRSRVNFFMNEFRKKGFITYNGSIEVHGSLRKALVQA